MKLILDCNNICYRSWFKVQDLTHEDRDVGVIFGFFNQLLKLATDFETNEIIFCWDSRKNYRKKIYSGYKDNRKKAKVDDGMTLFEQMDRIKELLPELGFNNSYLKTGYESDDLMAYFADKIADPEEVVIVTNDNDLLQCLTEDISVWNYKKLVTKKLFKKEHSLDPEKWNMVKAIAGCSSDAIPGVPGVGDKTAIKYLLGKLKETTKAWKAIDESQELIYRNLTLVTLPFMEGRRAIEFNPVKDSIHRDKFLKVFEGLNFKFFLREKNFQRWERALDI